MNDFSIRELARQRQSDLDSEADRSRLAAQARAATVDGGRSAPSTLRRPGFLRVHVRESVDAILRARRGGLHGGVRGGHV